MTEQLTAARESMIQRESLGKRPESRDSNGAQPSFGVEGTNANTSTHIWKKRTEYVLIMFFVGVLYY